MGSNRFVNASVPLAALAMDRALGDPPNRWHPVAWQGRLLELAARHVPEADGARFIYGGLVVLLGAGLSAAAGAAVDCLADGLPTLPGLLVRGAALKLAIASYGLDRAAGEVEEALRRGDLTAARRLLGWHLVSRPTTDLSATEVAGAAIESVSENLTDALVAPMCAWAVGGLPAVWAYRFFQTADSMWGYHDPDHEWLGKPAARADDAFNWLPARLASALLACAGAWHGADVQSGRQARETQAGQTASPNAGQTMAMMAGLLHVTLTKRGHYTLVGGTSLAAPDTLSQARKIVQSAALLAGAVISAIKIFA